MNISFMNMFQTLFILLALKFYHSNVRTSEHFDMCKNNLYQKKQAKSFKTLIFKQRLDCKRVYGNNINKRIAKNIIS